jgi:glycosyltransferase involved in cell wall biosynthesis
VIPLTSVTARAATLKPALSSRDSGSFRLVQIASLSRVKNQKLLLDALPIVRRRLDAHLDLVGEDTLNGELPAQAAAIGMTDHVTFHGFLPQPRAIEILEKSDLYVQSSLHEAAGVSVLEAAASGVPAIGTRAGYIADWSPQKAVAVGDPVPESLADAIVAIHADADRRRSMAALAQAFSVAHDAAWSAAQFDDLYRNLRI